MDQHALQRIESSEWAERLRQDCPNNYLDALSVALETHEVTIEPRYAQEIEGESINEDLKGRVLWVLLSANEPDFWLDAHWDPEALEAVCEEMGWEIRCDAVH